MQARIEDLERKLATARRHSFEPEDIDSNGGFSTQHSASRAMSDPIPTPVSSQANLALYGNGFTSYPSTSATEPPTTMSPGLENVVEPPSHTVLPWTSGQLDFLEGAAAQAGAVHLSLPASTVAHLLRTHAVWFHPAFCFTMRPYFLRDSACGGPFSSPLLIASICLHATRFTRHHLEQDLLTRVRLLLGQTLHQEPTIPTVQSLLFLSAFELGRGSLSQGWLYSGMAYRMAVDLGIFSKVRSKDLDPVHSAMTEQLAWSCFSWDKAVSLYLGRTPSLPKPPNFEPRISIELGETIVWKPYFDSEETQDNVASSTLSTLSHVGSCRIALCKLMVIVNDILLTIYVNRPAEPLAFVSQTRQRLEQWRTESPGYLIVDPRGAECPPPPHVLTLNALYHAASILLNRPFRQVPGCLAACRTAAEAIEGLVVIFDNSYGLTHVTYLLAYCAYTAATVTVLDMHDGVDGSPRAANSYLRALYGIRKGCPGIQPSIDIIVKAFDTGNSATYSPPCAQLGPSNTAISLDFLPASPFDPSMEQSNCQSMDDLNSIQFGGLDTFAMEWSRVPMEGFDEYVALENEKQGIFQAT